MSWLDLWICWCISYGSFKTVDLLFDVGKWVVGQLKLRRLSANGLDAPSK